MVDLGFLRGHPWLKTLGVLHYPSFWIFRTEKSFSAQLTSQTETLEVSVASVSVEMTVWFSPLICL